MFDESYIVYYILRALIWPIIIIGLIIWGIVHFVSKRRKKRDLTAEDDKHLRIALSKEDAVSQFFFLLSIFFLGTTLLALNRELNELVSVQTILLITSIIGIIISYFYKALFALAVSVIGLIGWWGGQAATWIDTKDIKLMAAIGGLMFIAILLYLIGHAHEKNPNFKRPSLLYLVLGTIGITAALFTFSTKSGIYGFQEMTQGLIFFGSWQLTVSLSIFIFLILGVLGFNITNKLISLYELMGIVALTILTLIFILLPEQKLFADYGRSYYSSRNTFSDSGILWAVFFNILIFLELLGLILTGYLRKENWRINLGALFVFILIFVKYFDWLFNFLDKSVFFIGAGVIFFLVGWLMEKGRRYVIETIEEEHDKPQIT